MAADTSDGSGTEMAEKEIDGDAGKPAGEAGGAAERTQDAVAAAPAPPFPFGFDSIVSLDDADMDRELLPAAPASLLESACGRGRGRGGRGSGIGGIGRGPPSAPATPQEHKCIVCGECSSVGLFISGSPKCKSFRCMECHNALKRLEHSLKSDPSQAGVLQRLRKNRPLYNAEIIKNRAMHSKGMHDTAAHTQSLQETLFSSTNSKMKDNAEMMEWIHYRAWYRYLGELSDPEIVQQWEKEKSDPDHPSEQLPNGKVVVMVEKPLSVSASRKSGISRNITSQPKALKNADDVSRAQARLRSVSQTNLAGDASFSATGSLLLRKGPQVAVNRDQQLIIGGLQRRGQSHAGTSVSDELSLSQDVDPEEEQENVAVASATAVLMKKQQLLRDLAGIASDIKKQHKDLKQQRDHKSFAELEATDKELLDLPTKIDAAAAAIKKIDECMANVQTTGKDTLTQVMAAVDPLLAEWRASIQDWETTVGTARTAIKNHHSVAAKARRSAAQELKNKTRCELSGIIRSVPESMHQCLTVAIHNAIGRCVHVLDSKPKDRDFYNLTLCKENSYLGPFWQAFGQTFRAACKPVTAKMVAKVNSLNVADLWVGTFKKNATAEETRC